jgi:hypothetical protein
MPGAAFTDVDAFFDAAEFGSAATWQSRAPGAAEVAGVVLLDAPDEDALDDIRAAAHRITYRPAQWAGVREGDRVTIAGQLYTVRRVAAIDDGQLARADLQRAD